MDKLDLVCVRPGGFRAGAAHPAWAEPRCPQECPNTGARSGLCRQHGRLSLRRCAHPGCRQFLTRVLVVPERPEGLVCAGLVGVTPVDELSGDRADGPTATNLRRLGPADAAQAWVALWGLGLTPIAHQAHSASRTATHVSRASRGPRAGTFVRVPLPLLESDGRFW